MRGDRILEASTLALLLLTMALAGCTSDANDPEAGDTAQTSADTTATGPGAPDEGAPATTTDAASAPPEQGQETPSGENRPPAASIGASSPGGDVPFDVNFTFNATDPDGDELSWTLDVDGDGEPETEGTHLPSVYTYTYDTEGTYNVTFSVSDGEATVNETVTVDATAAAGASDTFSGSWISGPYGCAFYSTAPGGAFDGILFSTFVITPETMGRPFTATMTPDAAAGLSMFFVNEAGDIIDRYTTDASTGPETFTGLVADGTHYAFWSSCGGPASVEYSAGG